MAVLSKEQLIVENNQSFPNNNAGAITPDVLRSYNRDVIDSTVNQTTYTENSQSLFTTINSITTSIDVLQDFSSSQHVINQTLVTSGSNTFNGNQTINGDLILNHYQGTSVSLVPSAVSGGLYINNNVSINGTLTASLQDGYLWIGGSGDKLKAVTTSSLGVNLTSLNSFTASQETKNTTLATYTGSLNTKFTTIGTQSGSWDNTVLNSYTASQNTKNTTLGTYTGSNDTKWSNIGSQSGSFARTNTTNSFTGSQTISGSLNVIGTITATEIHTIIESSSVIFSSGSNILGDASNDTQTLIGTTRISGSTQITGSTGINGSTNITGSLSVNGSPAVLSNQTGSIISSLNALNSFTQSQTDLNQTLATTGSNTFYGQQYVNGPISIYETGNPLTSTTLTQDSLLGKLAFNQAGGTGFYFGNPVEINGNTQINGNIDSINSNATITLRANTNNSGSAYTGIVAYTDTTTDPTNVFSAMQIADNTGGTNFGFGYNSYTGDYTGYYTAVPMIFGGGYYNGTDTVMVVPASDKVEFWKPTTFKYSTIVSGSVRGNVNTQSISSNTASFDFSTSNFFELTLASGTTTRINATNIKPGQTINVKVTQASSTTGSVSFDSKFKFPAFSTYTASLQTSAVDILTFVTFNDTSSVYSVAVKNFQ